MLKEFAKRATSYVICVYVVLFTTTMITPVATVYASEQVVYSFQDIDATNLIGITTTGFTFDNTVKYGSANDGINFNEFIGFGNTIYLGNYDHAAKMTGTGEASSYSQSVLEKEGQSQPILWRMGGEFSDEGYILAMSEYVLDSRPFHGNNNTIDYSTSDIRKWLNNGFFNNAFFPAEQKAIVPTTVRANHSASTVSEANNGIYRENEVFCENEKVYLPPLSSKQSGVTASMGGVVNTISPDIYEKPNLGKSLLYKGVGINIDWIYPSGKKLRNGIGTLADGRQIEALSRFMLTYNHAGRYYASSSFGINPVIKINPESIIYAESVESVPSNKIKGETTLYSTYISSSTGQTINGSSQFFTSDESGETRYNMYLTIKQDISTEDFIKETTSVLKSYFDQQKFTTYKLTLLNPDIKLNSLSINNTDIQNGNSIGIISGNMTTLTASASGNNNMAYKIVQSVSDDRIIVGYGEGSTQEINILAKDFNGNNLVKGGDYTLYVWAQKDNSINSNEASTPMYFKLVVGEQNPLSFDFSLPANWAIEKVQTADKLGLITPEMRGAYQSHTTRAEFCRAAVNLLRKYGYDVDSVTPKMFSDAADRDIGIAASLGISSGTNSEKNLFSPDNPLTRQEAATMLRNVLDVLGVSTIPPPGILWTDAKDIADWAQSAADVMYGAKIMGGTSSTELVFSPKTPYTHEQSIVTLINLWEYVKWTT